MQRGECGIVCSSLAIWKIGLSLHLCVCPVNKWFGSLWNLAFFLRLLKDNFMSALPFSALSGRTLLEAYR
jgi:hypothetical protein